MLIFRKRIKPSEIVWGDTQGQKDHAGQMENTVYRMQVDKQFRLRFQEWLKNHPQVKAGDEVLFLKEKGT